MADVCHLPIADSAIEKYAAQEAKLLRITDADERYEAGCKWIEEIANDSRLNSQVSSTSDVWDLMVKIDKRAFEILECKERQDI